MADPSSATPPPLCAAPAARTAFDVAVWFLDRARADDAHLPLQKLHRLLFIAQAAYAAGGMLMPAVFVADELGPIEPNLERLLGDGRPEDLPAEPPNRAALALLEDVWRRFGYMPADRLGALVAKNAAYAAALAAGRGSVIAQSELAGSFAPAPAKLAEDVRMLRSQSGAAVAVRAWIPGAKTPA
ncbi:MAG: Panacea domain-containing protein [Alphaproteobacteria bacterium]